MSSITLLSVVTPAGNGYTEPALMKRVDDHLAQTCAAFFESDAGGPIKQPDGSWRVRAKDERGVRLAEMVLVHHYGLEIVGRESVPDGISPEEPKPSSIRF